LNLQVDNVVGNVTNARQFGNWNL